MTTPTLFTSNRNSNANKSTFLLYLLTCLLLIPMYSNAKESKTKYLIVNEETCEESTMFFHTENDSYSTLTFNNTNCCDNATTPTDGQFTTTIEIVGLANTAWYVVQSSGYYKGYDCETEVRQEPMDFVTGPLGDGVFTESPIMGVPDSSLYTLKVITVHRELLFLRLGSSRSDIAIISSQSLKYLFPEITGPISTCEDTEAQYSVPGNFDTYNWSIMPPSAGSIDDSKANPIVVTWGDEPGTHQLIFEGTDNNVDCYAPAILDVAVGGSVINSMKCRGPMNLSLADQCELKITPELVLTPGQVGNAPFAVMIMDKEGNVIPNATFNYNHVGKTFEVKVFDGCSQNTCWTNITVEDKKAPEILCPDEPIEVACNKVDQYTGPFVKDNCEVNITPELIESNYIAMDCNEDYVGRFEKKYIATDSHGNVSKPCMRTILIERINIEEVVGPPSFLVSNSSALSCDDYKNVAPTPEIGGVPTYLGELLYPSETNNTCNTFTTFSDEPGGTIGCTTKIVRTWRVYEWYCGGTIDTSFIQMFEITDTTPPSILSQIPDMTLSAATGDCQAQAYLPAILAEDACNEVVNITVDGLLNSNGGFVLLDLGINHIKYYVRDQCGNTDSLEYDITVIDKTPPLVICDHATTVGLDILGDAYVPYSVFNNMSSDACRIDSIRVRRMQDTDVTCFVIPTEFRPFVEFCCDDAGKTRMVEMKVWDSSGNMNSCMVEVIVQDKFPPELEAPKDITISCLDEIDLNDLSKYGSPIITDACGVSLDSTVVDSINACRVGKIIRTFTASDSNGSSSDSQTITVRNFSPFNLTINDPRWPEDFASDSLCGDGDVEPDDLPEGFQRPDLSSADACAQVSATHIDEEYPFPSSDSDACFKILRKWTVIDWCQKERNGDFKTWTHDQILKISNTDKPVFSTIIEDQEVCSTTCDGGPINFGVAAYDTCTASEDLRWEYNIDLDFMNNPSIDSTLTGNGDTTSINGMFPIGKHKILWTFFDGCGNKTTKEQLFTIKDCNGPVAVAVDGFSIGLVGMDLIGNDGIIDTEMACIQADSVDASSSHPCDIPITFSFSIDTTDKERCFDCNDLGNNDLYLYVTDIFGNVDSVKFSIDVQDNNIYDICRDPRDCIIFPADTTITACDPDLSDVALGRPVVDPDCMCDIFTIDPPIDVEEPIFPNAECLAITRKWTVTFNCGGDPIVASMDQLIMRLNNSKPTLVCIADTTVSTDKDSCNAQVDLADVTGGGSCNESITITNDFNSGGANASGIYPIGTTTVQFIGVDPCGNADTCSVDITVVDNQGPTCTIFPDVTINVDNGVTRILTMEDVDNGSLDACDSTNLTFMFSDSTFVCADTAAITIVTVTVADTKGNDTTCVVNVTVEDITVIHCEAKDITVYLDEFGNASILPIDLDNGSSAGCDENITFSTNDSTFTCIDLDNSPIDITLTVATADTSTSCIAMVTLIDSFPPIIEVINITLDCNDFDGDFSGVGGLMITDACNTSGLTIDTLIENESLNVCNIGFIIRKFVITDSEGNMDTTAEQLITILGELDPFNLGDITFPPADVTVEDCNASITPVAIMSITTVNTSGDSCSMVTIDFDDTTISSGNACQDTIQRIWTVVDSCQFNAINMSGMWRDTQLIILTDTIPPVVSGPPSMMVDNSNTTSDCEVTVVLPAGTAVDNCSSEGELTFTNNSPHADNPNSGDVSGDYPPGEFTITITATDKCGNMGTYEFTLTIEEPSSSGLPCVKLFANITDQQTSVVTPASFGVTNATDCYNPAGLTFSFDRVDLTVSSLTFVCNQVGQVTPPNLLGLTTPLYAFDAQGTLVDSCLNTVTVTDFNGNCQGNINQVSGNILTPAGEDVEGVMVSLNGDVQESEQTSATGSYAFSDLAYGANVVIKPYKNDDVLNGVSTLDIIRIQRHLLGQEEFITEHQRLAADINNSMSISATDIIELRKTILGIYDEFPRNSSWRMVEGSYKFPEVDNPFAENWPEDYTVSDLDRSMVIDFVGVKIGDVDGDVLPNSRSRITTRGKNSKVFETYSADGTITFKTTEDLILKGIQLGLNISGSSIEVESDLIGFNAGNYYHNNDNRLNISWNSNQEVDLPKGTEIFKVKGVYNDEITVDSEFKSELYLLNNGGIDVYSLSLKESLVQGLNLRTNTPNPWTDHTTITFSISYDDVVTLNVYDAGGKQLVSKNINATKGLNRIRINNNELESSGLLFYDITTSREKRNGKMILLK